MKVQIHSKILAIAAAAMIGLATAGGAALARGGGGFGGWPPSSCESLFGCVQGAARPAGR